MRSSNLEHDVVDSYRLTKFLEQVRFERDRG